MTFTLKTTACALAVSAMLFPALANAWEKDKTYDITILHTNDHHGHFWQNDHGEYGLSAQKTLVDGIRKEVEEKGAHCCCSPAGISIPACRNLIYRMPSRISKG